MVYAKLPHTPQISAAQHYGSHVTALGGYSLWGDCTPSDGHSGTQTPPILYRLHSLRPHPHLHPSAEGGKNMEKCIWKFMMSQLWKDRGQFLCCCFGHNPFLWLQERLGSLPTVLPKKGEQLKLSTTMSNSFRFN